jgi:potassium channel subfamily K
MAATLGPLANVSSIAALVTSWRQTNFVDGAHVPDFEGVTFPDPKWYVRSRKVGGDFCYWVMIDAEIVRCYWINVASLICGFLGNLFLLLNFTQRIRYIIALPTTIVFWYLSSGFLIAITACMNIYVPPDRPNEGCKFSNTSREGSSNFKGLKVSMIGC